MSRPDVPLTLEEARLVASQIRNASAVDASYWPRVVNGLCDEVAYRGSVLDEREAEIARLKSLLWRVYRTIDEGGDDVANIGTAMKLIEGALNEAR
jgi:hypothetical protein